ncbi:ATP-dependent DNA ligase [Patescibacteria group bacterium]|nr:ATP-dependent DNA ligase [Patescibacteria group bacterium]
MFFRDFSLYLQKIEAVSARLSITAILADLFKDLSAGQQDPDEIVLATYLMQGSLVPSYLSLEFQMSEKMLIKTLARVQGKDNNFKSNNSDNLFAEIDQNLFEDHSVLEKKLSAEYKKMGDIGELFEKVLTEFSSDKTLIEQLSITQVHQFLSELASTSGLGSQDKKIELLAKLLQKLDPLSARYISRIILSKMRLGFSTMTLIDSLSFVKNNDKSDSANLERAFFKKADLGKLAKAYLLDHRDLNSDELLKTYQVELGIPVLPVLCQRLNSAQEIIEKMGEVLAEPKYDGLRVQIHINKEKFADSGLLYKAFTRNLEDVTHMFPELAEVASALKVKNCILDTEAIGIDKKTGKFLSFQETIQRKRKHDISAKALEVPICFYAFDLLLLDDQVLIDRDLLDRKAKLNEVLKDSEFIKKTEYSLISDPSELKSFHEQQLNLGLEGAVMKQGSSAYISGRKSWRWVKIKEEEGSQGKLSDTIDCLMLGYYLGKGKRQVFGIGALLVGVLDKDKDGNLVVRSLSKIGTGLTDEQFREVKNLADKYPSKNNQKPALYDVDKNLFPDVWLEPRLVLEIAADEISKSPIHSAGVALRFPRLVQIRYDKSFENATTLEELSSIHIAG